MKKIIPICLLIISLVGCTSSSINYEKMITVNEINLWINLMPGGPPTFHFSGQVGAEIEIAEDIELIEVRISQNQKQIFSEKPFFTRLSKQVPQYNKYLYIFGIKEGLPSNLINSDSLVDVILIFDVNGDRFSITLNKLSIEKVY
ncbi:MAG: hypothetical protein Q8N03_13545 [Ignavibacteria bacterium]|jgi:hypothetical protein|nr:hypothetical protein [Ignavibacteria bacterium]